MQCQVNFRNGSNVLQRSKITDETNPFELFENAPKHNDLFLKAKNGIKYHIFIDENIVKIMRYNPELLTEYMIAEKSDNRILSYTNDMQDLTVIAFINGYYLK